MLSRIFRVLDIKETHKFCMFSGIFTDSLPTMGLALNRNMNTWTTPIQYISKQSNPWEQKLSSIRSFAIHGGVTGMSMNF